MAQPFNEIFIKRPAQKEKNNIFFCSVESSNSDQKFFNELFYRANESRFFSDNDDQIDYRGSESEINFNCRIDESMIRWN